MARDAERPLRIGFDMDGVLADFAGAFHEFEQRLFPSDASLPVDDPEAAEAGADSADARPAPNVDPHESRRRRAAVWAAIQATPDFWVTLEPLRPGAVSRLHRLMLERPLEVFFLTQRPWTAGETVQRQTQRWLVAHGFDLPSVLVIAGSRGAAAQALRLDYHVDDNLQNCLDVKSESGARTILVTESSESSTASVRRLGIACVPDVSAALDILEEASKARTNPTLLRRLGALIGWE